MSRRNDDKVNAKAVVEPCKPLCPEGVIVIEVVEPCKPPCPVELVGCITIYKSQL